MSWYECEEAAGQRQDSHTNALHLTDTNGVTREAGPFGNYAARFDSSLSQKLEHVDAAPLQLGPSYTLATCVYLVGYPANWVNAGLLLHAVGEPNWEGWEIMLFATGVNEWRFGAYSGENNGSWDQVLASSLGKPALATWYKVIAWRDPNAGTLNIQVNKGPIDSVPLTCGMSPSNSPLRVGVGYNGTSQYLNGRQDKMGIWNRVLTASQRERYFNGWIYGT